MKKFTKTINGEKYKGEAFEKLDIMNKFERTEQEWELINKYQKIFPQLLIDDIDEFVIDARTLWMQLGTPHGDFSNWVQRKILKKSWFEENRDYTFDWYKGKTKYDDNKSVDVKLDINNINQMVRNGYYKEYTLTLDCAKSVCMMESTENGQLCRSYFILIEKILKKYEIWEIGRESEKEGWKRMKHYIQKWCVTNNYDATNDYFYIREANLLNEALTGFKACDIRNKLNVVDNQTRNNLTYEINDIISKLQDVNIALLLANMNFEKRKEIIEDTCRVQYSHIKEMFN